MTRLQWLALMLGLLLVAAPVIRAHAGHDHDHDDDDDDEDDAKSEDDVFVLTTSNFDDKIKEAKYALVEFYAPWCGHCKKLAPEYAKAATTLKAHDATILIAKVDATVEPDLGKKFGVSGYPTIKWFVNGEVAMDYNGARDAPGIVAWIKKKTGPAAAPLADKDALAAAEKEHEVAVVAYFKELKGDAYDAFVKVAQKVEDAGFFETTDAAVAKAAGLAKPGVAVIANFEGEERKAVAVKGDATEESITELLNSEKLPPTIEFNDKNGGKIFKSGIQKQLLLLAKAKELKKDAKLYKAYRAAALEHKGKLVFVTVDLDGTAKDPVVNYFGAKGDDGPILFGFEVDKNKKYKLQEKATDKTIKSFAEDFLADKLTPEFKSAPIPAEPKDGGVSVIVGKNFDDVVKDETKDVLLEVYAPWCGHCKQLEPIYKKLAKRFAKVDSVVIAKMDGTENEHPDVDVKGFPTIIFFPAEKGAKPVPYSGDRTLKGFTKFLKESAKIKFELPKKKKEGDDKKEDEEEDKKDEL